MLNSKRMKMLVFPASALILAVSICALSGVTVSQVLAMLFLFLAVFGVFKYWFSFIEFMVMFPHVLGQPDAADEYIPSLIETNVDQILQKAVEFSECNTIVFRKNEHSCTVLYSQNGETHDVLEMAFGFYEEVCNEFIWRAGLESEIDDGLIAQYGHFYEFIDDCRFSVNIEIFDSYVVRVFVKKLPDRL